jgi:hypothetical protein
MEARRRNSKIPLFSNKPVDGFYLTVISHARDQFEVTQERLQFLLEYLDNRLNGRKFEIFCIVPIDISDSTYVFQMNELRSQMPELQIGFQEGEGALRSFIMASLRGRGTFIIDEDYLESELPALPAEETENYLKFIDAQPKSPYFTDLESLILVSASKYAAQNLFTDLHLSTFGRTSEFRHLAEAKGLEMRIEKRTIPEHDHSLSYWVIDRIASTMVPFMYKHGLWKVH